MGRKKQQSKAKRLEKQQHGQHELQHEQQQEHGQQQQQQHHQHEQQHEQQQHEHKQQQQQQPPSISQAQPTNSASPAALVKALGRSLTDAPQARAVLYDTIILLSAPDGDMAPADDFVAAGGCATFTVALRAFLTDPLLSWCLCSVLAHLALQVPASREKLRVAGACEALVSVLQRHLGDAKIAAHAASAMCRLPDLNAACALRLTAAGAAPLLFAALRAHPQSHLPRWRCWARWAPCAPTWAKRAPPLAPPSLLSPIHARR
jgi:hypothetical protein